MEMNTCALFLLTCLLGILSQQVLTAHAVEVRTPEGTESEGVTEAGGDTDKATEDAATTAEEEGRVEGDQKSGNQETEKRHEEKEQRRDPFPVGHRIEVQVHHGVYIVERAPASPEVLTISLQLPDGTMQQFGFVPMSEVTAMLEEAESLGSGLPQALLDAKFLSYAFDQEDTAIEVTKPDIMTTTKLAQEFIEAEAEAEEQGRINGKKHNEDDDEEGDEDDDEEGDEEDGEEEDEDDEDEEEEEKDTGSKEASLRGSRN